MESENASERQPSFHVVAAAVSLLSVNAMSRCGAGASSRQGGGRVEKHTIQVCVKHRERKI